MQFLVQHTKNSTTNNFCRFYVETLRGSKIINLHLYYLLLLTLNCVVLGQQCKIQASQAN